MSSIPPVSSSQPPKENPSFFSRLFKFLTCAHEVDAVSSEHLVKDGKKGDAAPKVIPVKQPISSAAPPTPTIEPQKAVADVASQQMRRKLTNKEELFLLTLKPKDKAIIEKFMNELGAFEEIVIQDVLDLILGGFDKEEMNVIYLYLKVVLPSDLLAKKLSEKEMAEIPPAQIGLLHAYNAYAKTVLKQLADENNISPAALKGWSSASYEDQIYGLKIIEVYQFIETLTMNAKGHADVKHVIRTILGGVYDFGKLPPLERIIQNRGVIEALFREVTRLNVWGIPDNQGYIKNFNATALKLKRLPHFLKLFTNLQNLSFKNAGIENARDFNFSCFKQLRTLDLSGNNLLEPPYLANNIFLREVNLSNNPELAKLPEISTKAHYHVRIQTENTSIPT